MHCSDAFDEGSPAARSCAMAPTAEDPVQAISQSCPSLVVRSPAPPASRQVARNQDPDSAPSDGPNMVPIKEMPVLLKSLMEFDALAKAQSYRERTAAA